ncbi:MAG TPA: SPFH domain-containing protein [Spirochaetota bacterium]|nr:SPFH domain-containing protein [Spirochaetota bacterium]
MALLDVVQWDNKPGEVIFKFEEGAIALGSQLIVKEGQEAIFFKNGQALDSYGPGRHTLSTGNVPLLEKLVNLPFGGKTPFPAEVYFINKTEIPNMKWGTKQPMQLMDPVYNLPVPIRAFGSYSIRINDVKSFLITATGTWQAFTTDAISTGFRDLAILPKVQDLVAEFMIKQEITILKLPAYYDEIGVAGKAKLGDDFTSFGVELVRFAVESINIPDDDENVQRLKKALADKAEMNIMGDDYKVKRTFDTMEKAAGNEGMTGGMVGAGMGVGMGQQMGAMMGNAMGNATGGQQQGQQVACPKCNAMNQAGAKFCAACGAPMQVAQAACPACNAQIPAGVKFCPSCGANLQGSKCKNCNADLKPGAKFCPECGTQQ